MEDRSNKKTNKTTLTMSVKLKLKFGIIVAIAASCLLAAPST
ncbi:MAG: hypothetical protein V1844_26335 [Pseudomonadota bacterium]